MNEFDLNKRLKWTRIRIIMVAVVLLLAAGTITARAWEIQIMKYDEYSRKAQGQQRHSAQLPASRGAILDRNGDELAISVLVPSIYANCEEVKDPHKTADVLAPILDMPKDNLAATLSKKRKFIWLKRRVSDQQAGRIEAADLPGISITRESKRFYPHRRLASHVLGFGGYDAVGLEGLELIFNKELIGSRPVITGLRDANGRMIFSEGLSDESLSRENKLVLSIDKTIQSIAEEEINEYARLFEAKAASVVIIRPNTGEILAIANYPDFNPNLYWKFSPQERRNRAITDRFEPGSTMKIFTMATALDSKTIKLTDTFFCHNGEYRLDDLVIRDSRKNDYLSPVQIIQRSSNIGITQIAFQTGKAKHYKMLRRFGFGAKTDVQFPGETAGFIRHYSQWYDVDFASISFGHGIGVSVLQLAMATAAIANGGKLLKPILVKKIVSSKGNTVMEFKPKLVREVIEKKTARILGKMMVSVTQEGGTGMEAAVQGFLVSGKTGTAQKPDTISGGYTKDSWIASFVGFVPTDDPQLAMAIVFDEPLIHYYGGVVAAPLFRKIAEKSLRYLGIIPKVVTSDQAFGKMQAEEDKEAENQAKEKEKKENQAQAAQEAPGEPEMTCKGDCVAVPDFTGLSLPLVLNEALAAGLSIDVAGSGRAVGQSIEAGVMVVRGTEISVHFGSASM
ncbi:MAG: penicillin-binding protein [Pseudomonadota bacterium]